MDTKALHKTFLSHFKEEYAKNDPAHRAGHFVRVEKDGLAINSGMKLGLDDNLIVHFAWLHDLFAWSRADHHELSAQWVLTSQHPILTPFSLEERQELSLACRYHRASKYRRKDYDGQSVFVNVCAAADRGQPDNPMDRVKRAIEYRAHSIDNATMLDVKEALLHVKEKFGSGNLDMYPKVYTDYYGDALHNSFEEIARMTVDDVVAAFPRLGNKSYP